jgi:hypothetical protein
VVSRRKRETHVIFTPDDINLMMSIIASVGALPSVHLSSEARELAIRLSCVKALTEAGESVTWWVDQ